MNGRGRENRKYPSFQVWRERGGKVLSRGRGKGPLVGSQERKSQVLSSRKNPRKGGREKGIPYELAKKRNDDNLRYRRKRYAVLHLRSPIKRGECKGWLRRWGGKEREKKGARPGAACGKRRKCFTSSSPWDR